jgi:hypothetical protein
MTAAPVETRVPGCAKCGAPIPSEAWNREDFSTCSICQTRVMALVFPALFRDRSAASAPALAAQEGEAACFYHTAKKAAAPCDQCGRFLCALCRVDFLGANWCPGCIENNRRKGKLAQLDNSRTLYDGIALALAVGPMLLIWATILTAPATLWVTAKYWRAPSSLAPRSRWRFYAAALIAIVQIGAWMWLLLFLIYKR